MLLLVVMAGRWLGAAVIFLCKLGLQVVQGIEELGVLLNQRQLLALQPADFEGLREGVCQERLGRNKESSNPWDTLGTYIQGNLLAQRRRPYSIAKDCWAPN